MSEIKNPMQPLVEADGVIRFKANAIVRHLLDNGGIDLNQLARMEFSQDDRVQFAQLIGYSLSGFGELGYVNDHAYDTAVEMQNGTDEKDARIKVLEDKLRTICEALRPVASAAFERHIDDFEVKI